MRGVDDRLESRATQPVHGEGRSGNRESRLEPHMAGQVDGVRRSVQHVAEYHAIYFFGGNAGPLHRAPAYGGAQLGG